MAFSSAEKKEESKERDSKWIDVQVKGLTAYLNSYIGRVGVKIDPLALTAELKDGVKLSQFCEIVSGKQLKYDTTPSLKIQRIQNLSSAISFMKQAEPEGLGIRILGIGAEDIEHENLKLVLGLIYTAFRKLRLSSLASELGKDSDSRSSEAKLMLEWVQKMTAGYKGVDVTDFKTSFKDGLAFCALVDRFADGILDYDGLSGDNSEENLELAFSKAAERMGVPQLLEIPDVASGKADERSMVLYTSLMYHAFRQQAEIDKVKEGRKSLAEQIDDLTAQKEELEKKLAERDNDVAGLKEKIKNLEEELEKLKKDSKETMDNEIAKLRSQLEEEEALRKAFEDEAKARDGIFESLDEYFKEDYEKLRGRLGEDGELLEGGEGLGESLEGGEGLEGGETLEGEGLEEGGDRETLEDGEGMDTKEGADDSEKKSRKLVGTTRERKAIVRQPKTRAQLKKETQDINKRLMNEVKRNVNRDKEMQKLREENKALKKKIIEQQKAHSGLSVLKKNLEEHLEDLYRWRDLYQLDLEPGKDTTLAFDLDKVTSELANKNFDEQMDLLNDKLEGENRNLLRILKIKNAKMEVADTVTKKGWLYTKLERKKEYNKGYFVLRNYTLMYYPNDTSEVHDYDGSIRLDQPCELTLLKTDKSADGQKIYPIRINISGKEDKSQRLYIATLSKRDRRNWLASLTGKAVQFNYLKDVEEAARRPDTRLLALFEQDNVSSLFLDQRPLPKEGVAALTRMLSCYDAINEVSLVNAGLTDKSCKILATNLGRMHIKSINLSKNVITNGGAELLGQALSAPEASKLEEINLSGNSIEDAGAVALSAILTANKGIKQFSLEENSIGNEGVSAIAKALKEGAHPIDTLNLSSNKFGDEGAKAIAELIATSTTITSLNLSRNIITDEGLAAIVEALKKNTSVSYVDFSVTDISNKGAMMIADLLKENKQLHTVDISGCPKLVGAEELKDFFTNSAVFLPSLRLSRAQL